ncbi:putative flagellar hook-length control protein [Clostridium bornimense]|uniref:Putative flagellar hook-length control protein n=1 Tax=Clostridium bornimense TaxID=1216932 RepID=W6RWQ9_9CLOT|nr:flagellar hook-length control protein FliK [Clostridium bornimense]CDM68798.1 putative flagellar hook-length control protein [Clostridium bornimense]
MRKIGNSIASFIDTINNMNSAEKSTGRDINIKSSNSFKECLDTKNKSIKNENSKEKDFFVKNSNTIDDTAKIKKDDGKNSIEDKPSKVDSEESDSKEYDAIEELLLMLLNGKINDNYDYEKVISENEFLSEEVKTMILDLFSMYNSTENNDKTLIEGKSESSIADIMKLLKNDSSVDKEALDSILESVKRNSSEVESPKEILNYIKANVIKETNTDNNDILENKTTLINSIDENNIDLNSENNETSSESKNQEQTNKEDTFLTSLIEGNDNVKSEGNLMQVPKMVFEPLKDVKESAPALTNKTNIVEDIIKSVKYIRDESVKEIVLKVVPRNLGEVVISLSMDKGVMKANVATNNAETYSLLATKIEEMNKILNEFKVESFDLTYMNNSEYGEKNKEGNDQNSFQGNGKSSFISIEDDVIEETSDEIYSNIDMLA